MANRLTKKQREFVEEYAETGNGTASVLAVYDTEDKNTAAVIASENLRKPNIQIALEEALPDEMLLEVHREGLFASKEIWKNNNESGTIEHVGDEPDFAVRHKYLDTAYKLKGSYAVEKHMDVIVHTTPNEIALHAAEQAYLQHLDATSEPTQSP